MQTSDFKAAVRNIHPRHALLLTTPWVADNNRPEVRIDVIVMDSAAFGDVVMRTWGICFLGGVTRQQHCKINHNATGIRTLGDCYNRAGLEIQLDPVGIRHIRTMPQTTGTIGPIQTENPESIYISSFPLYHIPTHGRYEELERVGLPHRKARP